MAKRLTEHVGSLYIEAANRLKPLAARRRVVAYVESYDDILFWSTVLSEYETPYLQFDVMLPSSKTIGKGKKLAMNHHLGPGMIACVDADLDYLLQDATQSSRELNHSPYIFHTYAYSIENHLCYAPSLKGVCVMSTLNDRDIIDIEEYMRQYSRIVFPLLVWLVWVHRKGYCQHLTITAFGQTVGYHDISLHRPEETLEAVRRRVNKKVASMQRTFPQCKKDYAPLREELANLGVTPDNAYLYIQGHTLMNSVVLPLLTPICNALRKEREREIAALAMHNHQMENELSSYRHSQAAVDFMLRKNRGYRTAPPYLKLKEDLQNFVNGLQPVKEND